MSAPAPPVVLRWTPAPADIADVLDVYRTASPGVALKFPYLAALVFLLFAASLALMDATVSAVVAALCAVVLVVFGKRIVNRSLWRSAPILHQPVHAVVTPGSLQVASRGAASYSTTWDWPTFAYAVETDRSFVLLGRPAGSRQSRLFPYLPKRAAGSPVEVERLRALLAAVLAGGVRPR